MLRGERGSPLVHIDRSYTVSFLEYVVLRLYGNPLRTKGGGETWFTCPVPSCRSKLFKTLPDVAQYKHRCRCDKCKWGGDALDLVQYCCKGLPYETAQATVGHLRAAYERSGKI